jgi:hypothetical protein
MNSSLLNFACLRILLSNGMAKVARSGIVTSPGFAGCNDDGHLIAELHTNHLS